MEKSRKLLCLLLTVLLMLTPMATSLAVEGNGSEPPLSVEITTDKTKYGTFSTANFTVKITNVSNEPVSNVRAVVSLDKLTVTGKNSQLQKEIESLASGETLEFTYSAMLDAGKTSVNFFERIILFIVQLFKSILGLPDTGVDDGVAFVEKNKSVNFGKYEASALVKVAYGGNENRDFKIKNFYSNTVDILINTPTNVTFYAETECKNVIPEKLSILDQDMNFIGYMYDEDGDKTYTAVISAEQNHITNIDYFAQYEATISKRLSLCYYRDFTQTEIQDFEGMMAKVGEIESAQRQLGKTEKEIGEAIYRYIQDIKFIENISIDDNGNVDFITTFGVTGVWNIKKENRLGGYESRYTRESQQLGLASRQISEFQSDDDGITPTIKPSISNKNIVILLPFKSTDDNFYCDEYERLATVIANNIGGTVKIFCDDEVSIDLLKTLDDYGVVFFYSHGILSNATNHAWDVFDKDPYTLTGETSGFFSTISSADFIAGRIIISVSSGKRLGIGAKFYDTYYDSGDFAQTFFHFGSCNSMKNNTIADTLIEKGASWVQGYSNEVIFPNDLSQIHFILKYMLDETFPVGEAVEATLINPEAQNYKQDDCELRYQGERDFRFIEQVESGQFIRGVVKERTTEKPIANVSVRAYDKANNLIGLTYTEENGHFNIRVPEGFYTLQFDSGGYSTVTVEATVNKNTSVTLNEIVYLQRVGDDGITNWDFIVPVTHKKTVPDGYIPIFTMRDLYDLANGKKDDSYILMNDIELPIAFSWQPFEINGITLDGNGYSIKNLYTSGQGFFSHANGATIKNLALTNVIVNCSNDNVGALVGRGYFNNIDNCFTTGYVKGKQSVGGIIGIEQYLSSYSYLSSSSVKNSYSICAVEGDTYVGGICGTINVSQFNSGTIQNCYNAGNVTALHGVGGIVGYAVKHGDQGITLIDNCYNTGEVFGDNSVGGIVGQLLKITGKSKISNSYNTGKIEGNSSVGGLSGSSGGEIWCCYNTGEIMGTIEVGAITGIPQVNAVPHGIQDAYLFGCYYLSSALNAVGGSGGALIEAKELSDSEMKIKDNFVGFDFDTVWAIDPSINKGYPYLNSFENTDEDSATNYDFIVPVTHKKSIPDGYTGIYTAQDLDNMRNNLSGNYILMNDINLSDWGNWEPIGSNSKPFIGTLDGNGYEVEQLTILGLYYYHNVGLLGYVQDAQISNLGLDNTTIDIYNSQTGFYFHAGALCGYADGVLVDNCYNTGSVKAVSATLASFSGGLVGRSINSTNSITITNCFNTGDIYGLGYTGGIIGTTEINSADTPAPVNIKNCFNYGDIVVKSNGWAGGIVALTQSECHIMDSHNCGNISGEEGMSLGGIAGRLDGSITNCSNSGNVSGASNSAGVGGIVGRNDNCIDINNCYNTENVTGGIAGGIIGVQSGEMATINKCYNTGSISAHGSSGDTTGSAGGIIGFNNFATIVNSYNKGNVSSQFGQVGGLAGSSSNLTIVTSYNSGIVTAPINGGIIGISRDATNNIENCYYINSASTTIGKQSGSTTTLNNVVPLSELQMIQSSSFVGFDFDTIWAIDPNKNNGYPYLRTLEPREP